MFVDLDCEYQGNANLCRSEFTKNIKDFPVLRYYSLGYKDVDTYIECTLNSDWIDYISEIDEDLVSDETLILNSKTNLEYLMNIVFSDNRVFAICYFEETVPSSYKVIQKMRIFQQTDIKFAVIEHNYGDDSIASTYHIQ